MTLLLAISRNSTAGNFEMDIDGIKQKWVFTALNLAVANFLGRRPACSLLKLSKMSNDSTPLKDEQVVAILRDEWPAQCNAVGFEEVPRIVQNPEGESLELRGGASMDLGHYVTILTSTVVLIREIWETIEVFRKADRDAKRTGEIEKEVLKKVKTRKKQPPQSVLDRLPRLIEQVLKCFDS